MSRNDSVKCWVILQRRATQSCNTMHYGNTAKHSVVTWTHCNTLQHTATHCNTLQHTPTYCLTLPHIAHFSCNTLQHRLVVTLKAILCFWKIILSSNERNLHPSRAFKQAPSLTGCACSLPFLLCTNHTCVLLCHGVKNVVNDSSFGSWSLWGRAERKEKGSKSWNRTLNGDCQLRNSVRWWTSMLCVGCSV